MSLLTFILVAILGAVAGTISGALITGNKEKASSLFFVHCDHCGNRLSWWKGLPVFGFFLSGGRCSSCGKKIRIEHPASEITTIVLWLFVFGILVQSPLSWVKISLLSIFLLALTWMVLDDFLNKEINVIALCILSGSSIGFTIVDGSKIMEHLLSLIVFIVLMLAFYFVRKGSVQVGDILAGGVLSLFVLVEDLPFALLIVSTSGLLFWGVRRIFGGGSSEDRRGHDGQGLQKNPEVTIPMVPFLSLGFLSCSFLEKKYGSLLLMFVLR